MAKGATFLSLEPDRDAIAVSGSRSVWLPAIAGSHVANEIGHRRSGQSSDHISPGRELDGVLGEKFNFETPTNGGTLNILTASIHNTELKDFDLSFGPLASFEIPAGGFQADRRLDAVVPRHPHRVMSRR